MWGVLGECLTVKNYWGLLTGDDGVSLPFVLLEQLLDHKISHVYDQQVHEII